MKNILVTGGTAFVSRFTASYFAENGNHVYVLNRGSRTQQPDTELIKADRHRLKNELRDIYFDAVLDVTAYTGTDVDCLLDALGGFGDYVLVSSSAVYPETSQQPFKEELPTGLNSVWQDYGAGKCEAEKHLLQRVPRAYILRPPYFYGPMENLYRELFVFDCADLDRPFYLPENGSLPLQFFHVKDFCRFIEILLKKHPEQKIYNVGNSLPVTAAEWVRLCYKAAGKIPVIKSVSDSSVRSYFSFYDYSYTLDVSKQKELMPQTIALEEGLRQTYLWYCKNKDNSDIVRKPYFEYIKNHFEKQICL